VLNALAPGFTDWFVRKYGRRRVPRMMRPFAASRGRFLMGSDAGRTTSGRCTACTWTRSRCRRTRDARRIRALSRRDGTRAPRDWTIRRWRRRSSGRRRELARRGGLLRWCTARTAAAATEAEWERAARGGVEAARFRGATRSRRGFPAAAADRSRPVAVTLGEPNASGCTASPPTCTSGAPTGTTRLLRASPDANPRDRRRAAPRLARRSWRHAVTISRCAARSKIDPSFRYTDYGFARCGTCEASSRTRDGSRAPCATRADARSIVGGWVRDRLMGLRRRTSTSRCSASTPTAEGDPAAFGSVNTVGESFTVYKVGGLDVSLPRRESKTGPRPSRLHRDGRPGAAAEEAARAPRLHDQRDRLGSADRRVHRSVRRRGDLARRCCAPSIRARSATTACACCARSSSPRGSSSTSSRTQALCRTHPLDDLPAERIWGEFEKLLLRARARRSVRARPRDGRRSSGCSPSSTRSSVVPQEPEWHPEGDVWIHTLLVIDEARARIDDLAYPQQVAVMLGAVCHDLGKPAPPRHRRADPIARSRRAGRRAGAALLDRLNVQSLQGYDVRREVLASSRIT
jgi:hypothetical protein